jgi:hypothetical protein
VRYRRDATGLRRGTTIEIAVAEAVVNSAHADRQLFDVEIGYTERALRAVVRAHGGSAACRAWSTAALMSAIGLS